MRKKLRVILQTYIDNHIVYGSFVREKHLNFIDQLLRIFPTNKFEIGYISELLIQASIVRDKVLERGEKAFHQKSVDHLLNAAFFVLEKVIDENEKEEKG